MKDQIKQVRVKIDGLSQLVKELKPNSSKSILIIKTDKYCTQEDQLAQNQFLSKWNKEPFSFAIPKDIEYEIHNLNDFKEINKCYDSLILAKAWLGKVLGELGEATPYFKDGNRHELKDIEPTADTVKKGIKEMVSVNWFDNGIEVWKKTQYEPKNHIEKVDWLRQTIQTAVLNDIKNLELKGSRELAIARTNCYNHLSEARFHLGFELQKIKENGDNK